MHHLESWAAAGRDVVPVGKHASALLDPHHPRGRVSIPRTGRQARRCSRGVCPAQARLPRHPGVHRKQGETAHRHMKQFAHWDRSSPCAFVMDNTLVVGQIRKGRSTIGDWAAQTTNTS
jgi:hypothetical protein